VHKHIFVHQCNFIRARACGDVGFVCEYVYIGKFACICSCRYVYICIYAFFLNMCTSIYFVYVCVYVYVGRHVLQCVTVCCSVLQCFAVFCSVLQCVTVCCSVLECVGVCWSVLQCDAVCQCL